MMKKEYIMPEMIIRQVILEGFIAESYAIGDEEGSFEHGDARETDDWNWDKQDGDVWSD